MPTLALSMIVKDGEATLARCLDSVRGVVDEIVIADTGSADGSQEIARRYNARVFQIPWEKDFAKARNLSLAEVRSDWVLILDADEVLDSSADESIPSLLSHSTVAGYVVQIRNYLLEMNCHLWDQRAVPNTSAPDFARQYPAYVQHQNVRLFRRQPGVYFAGRVHETVGGRIVELGMKMEPADFLIHHLGFIADGETLARKYQFYRELGREKIRERPEDANAHFELGVEEFEHFHNNDEAIRLFARACELNPRMGVAWLFYGLALARAGKYREAIASFDQAEANGGRMHLVWEGRGDASYGLGDFGAARRSYLQALGTLGNSPQIESKLGLTEVRLAQGEEGLARLRKAIGQEPESAELYDRLTAAYAWLGRLREAAEAAEAKLTRVEPQPEYFMRAASLRAQLPDWTRVITLLRQGIKRFPESEKLQEAMVQAQRQAVTAEAEAKGDERYAQRDFESACRYYRQAVERLGKTPQIESKLGLAEVRSGRVKEGLDRLRRAIDSASKSAVLYDRLMGACVLLGRLEEAAETAEAKLRKIGLHPDSCLRAASLRAQLGQWPQVISLLREGVDRFPEAGKLRSALAETEAHVPCAPGD
ncbi:MAG: glycosyltransferase [Acidobacteriota bacterium]